MADKKHAEKVDTVFKEINTSLGAACPFAQLSCNPELNRADPTCSSPAPRTNNEQESEVEQMKIQIIRSLFI